MSQNNNIVKMSQKEALSIISDFGTDRLSKLFIEPMDLVYLNESNANQIIDYEFSNLSYNQDKDSLNVFYFDSPFYTIEVGELIYDEYIPKKLYDYYKSLPKYIKSDTLYNYNILDDILSILVYYNPKGLEQQLIADFKEWEEIAKRIESKKYKTKEQLRAEISGMTFQEILDLKEIDLILDVRYMAFQVAVAFQRWTRTHSENPTDFILSNVGCNMRNSFVFGKFTKIWYF